MAWGGTGGGMSESAGERAEDGRGGSSAIRETVLGGLATAIGTEEEEQEEEEEEEDEEEEGAALLPDSNLGGSRACFWGGGSCWESCAG